MFCYSTHFDYNKFVIWWSEACGNDEKFKQLTESPMGVDQLCCVGAHEQPPGSPLRHNPTTYFFFALKGALHVLPPLQVHFFHSLALTANLTALSEQTARALGVGSNLHLFVSAWM